MADEQQAIDHALLKKSVDDLAAKVEELEASLSGLVRAWEAAGALVSFVKWSAIVATSIASLAAFYKFGVHK